MTLRAWVSTVPELCQQFGCRAPVATWCPLCRAFFCSMHDELYPARRHDCIRGPAEELTR
jgi:hypothetical protein